MRGREEEEEGERERIQNRPSKRFERRSGSCLPTIAQGKNEWLNSWLVLVVQTELIEYWIQWLSPLVLIASFQNNLSFMIWFPSEPRRCCFPNASLSSSSWDHCEFKNISFWFVHYHRRSGFITPCMSFLFFFISLQHSSLIVFFFFFTSKLVTLASLSKDLLLGQPKLFQSPWVSLSHFLSSWPSCLRWLFMVGGMTTSGTSAMYNTYRSWCKGRREPSVQL